MLHAAGIPSRHARDGRESVLLVPFEFEEEALRELASYQAENRKPLTRPAPEWSRDAGRFEALGYAILVAAFYAADKSAFLGLDWHGEGRTEGARGVFGNVERALTSLTLHSDLKHLLSNVFYGCLFSVLFSQAAGAGAAWFVIVLSGFLGNLLSIAFSPPNIASLGASTMVFGALGGLAAYQWRVRKRANLGLKQWAPLVAGSVLLGFYGFGTDVRVNYMAHLTGFLAGVVAGAVLGSWRPLQFSDRKQHMFLGIVLASVAVAWTIALAF